MIYYKSEGGQKKLKGNALCMTKEYRVLGTGFRIYILIRTFL